MLYKSILRDLLKQFIDLSAYYYENVHLFLQILYTTTKILQFNLRKMKKNKI